MPMPIFSVCVDCGEMLGIELKALFMLDKHPTTKLCSQSQFK